MKRIICIYQIKNLVNGKIYVGSTVNYKARIKSHIRTLNKESSGCYKLQHAWKKYGVENFEFSIIEELSDLNIDLFKLEEHYILKYNTIENGYNIKLPFSETGFSNSTYSKKAIASLDYLLEHGPTNLKHMSKEEWIERKKLDPTFSVLKSKTGLSREEFINSLCKELKCYSLDFVYINTYCSIQEASKSLNVSDKAIGGVIKCNGVTHFGKKLKRVKAYIFIDSSFVNDDVFKDRVKELPIKQLKSPAERNVKRVPLSLIKDNDIREFVSMVEAAKYLDCSYSNIMSLVRGIKSKGGGKFSKVTHIKGWSIYSSTSV